MENKFRAFSLAEAIILIVVLAIALGAATPFITRKIQDVTTDLSGGKHGRYEFFMQEFICFADECNDNSPKWHKKIYDTELAESDSKRQITVYKKFSDGEFYKAAEKKPSYIEKDGRHYKSSIYQIVSNKAEPVFGTDGSITSAKDGDKTYFQSSNYIFDVTGVTFEGLGAGKRVIEGNLVEHYKKGSICKKGDGREGACYIIDGTNKNNFNGRVKVKPWQRKIMGKNRVVVDEEIKDKDKGIINGTDPFRLPEGIKNFTFHAVGGGGAGGQITDNNLLPDKPLMPANGKAAIKKHLAEAFRQYTKERYDSFKDGSASQKLQADFIKKGIGGTALYDLSDDKIVGETNVHMDKNYHMILNVKTNPVAKELANDKHFILLNTKDNTIIVKSDVRFGLIYPNQLLKHTYRLGSEKQQSLIYDMPSWFTPTDIRNMGFNAGQVACSSAGARGPSYQIKSISACQKEKCHTPAGLYCHVKTTECGDSILTGKPQCGCTYENGSLYGCSTTFDLCSSEKNADGTYKSCCTPKNGLGPREPITYTFHGSRGGSGVCVWLAMKVDEYANIKRNCGSIGSKSNSGGSSNTPTTNNNGQIVRVNDGGGSGSVEGIVPEKTLGMNDVGNVDDMSGICAGYGGRGRSCSLTATTFDNSSLTATALGGGNGSPCLQTLYYHSGYFEGLGNTCYFSSDPEGHGSTHIEGNTCTLNSAATGHKNCFAFNGSDSDNGTTEEKMEALGGLPGMITQVVAGNSPEDLGLTLVDTDKPFIQTTCDWLDKARCGPNFTYTCGTPGADGTIQWSGSEPLKPVTRTQKFFGGQFTKECTESNGSKGFGQSTGEYNYLYIWTIPYALDYLAYGEAGNAGEYKSETKPDLNGNLYITLGNAGTKDKPDGTATYIKYAPLEADGVTEKSPDSKETIIFAKGGKGGYDNKKTNDFNMCFAAIEPNNFKDGKTDENLYTCKYNKYSPDNEDKYCCVGNKASYSTKDINSTSVKYSEFDKKSAIVNNSSIVGLGLGRGAEGMGSGTFNEEIKGGRYAVNASTDPSYNDSDKIIVKRVSPTSASDDYKNEKQDPPYINNIGGGGAVIIIW